MIKAVFFDLDGTLLPMDEGQFVEGYFKYLCKKAASRGYESKKLIDTIWKGTYAMYTNDGKKTNEQVFWDYFGSVYGEKGLKDKDLFDDFYAHEFAQSIEFCEKNPEARKIIDFCKEHFEKVILSTNPIFPEIATLIRMGFINLYKEDFAEVTTYEDCSFCKPNPMYFKYLLEKHNLKPEEVILFGNNEKEDAWCAEQAGIKTYLIGNHIIRSDKITKEYPHISMEEVIPTLQSLISN